MVASAAMNAPTLSPANRCLTVVITSAAMSGCAPTFVLFGAYFPAWLLLAVIGVLAAAAARIAMVATGLARTVPYQLMSCTSIGVSTAIACWLIWLAR